MKKRQFIIIGSAILVLLIGKLGMDYMATPAELEKPVETEREVTVFTDEVALNAITLQVSTTGSLQAKDRMELFSEVQGLMLPDNGRFKAGTTFTKGQTLISLRADDARANVVSLRSNFERGLAAIMADIRIDYPAAFETWDIYLKNIDSNASLPPLPEVSDPKLKSYLTGRGIYSSFYSVRNAEINLSRFQISAPFSGILISSNVNPGTVVRPGQPLGVFVKPGVYELQASIDARTVARLAKGQKVLLYPDGDPNKSYGGTIVRINASIDPQTQMSDFFVQVLSDDLKEGQFMRVEVEAETIENSYEIPRSALQDSRYVYTVEDDHLKQREVTILHTTDKTAIVQGIENGEIVLIKLPPAAFEGMKVNVYSDSEGK